MNNCDNAEVPAATSSPHARRRFAMASLKAERSPPKTLMTLGNSFVIKNSKQTEWVAFELREGALESPTVTVQSATQQKRSTTATSPSNQSVKASTPPTIRKSVFPASADPERLFAAQRKRLAKSISGDWNQSSIPLREAVSFIAEREKIPIWLDERSLTGRTKPDTRINLDLGSGPLGAELQSRLRTYGLALVPPLSDKGDWELTTLKAASTHLLVRNYDVSDAKRLGVHMEMLVDAIPRHVRGSWLINGGDAGTIDIQDPELTLLKITQTWSGHDGVASLLEQLRAGPASDRYRQFMACAAQLEQPIKGRWDYQNAILDEVLMDIGTREGIQFRIDKRELELERLTPQIAVTIKAANGSLGSNLSLLLNPHGLTVVPLQDNGLQWTVTTIPASRTMQLSVIHPVRMTTRPPYNLSPIIQRIQGLKNTSWMNIDGQGGEITPFESFSGVAFAILQNWATQVAISQMLK